MKSLIFLLVLIFISIDYSQTNPVKQITNFDFDSRNPVFIQYPYDIYLQCCDIPIFSNKTEIIFESENSDSSTSICKLNYDAELDSFINLGVISSNNFINRNASGTNIWDGENGYKLLLFETNEAKNWDIAYSIDSGNGWTTPAFLFSSFEDEINPSFILNSSYNELMVTYSKGNSVFLYSKDIQKDSVKNILIFAGNDTLKYSNPAGLLNDKLYLVAVEQSNEKQRLVYRTREINDTLLSEIKNVYSQNSPKKPKFLNHSNLPFEPSLSFEIIINGKNKVLLMKPENFGDSASFIQLLEEPSIETSDLSILTFFAGVFKPRDDFYTWFPYSFNLKRNDSTFIRTSINDYYINPYFDFYTKISTAKPDIGPLSITYGGIISYTIWEDSSNGRINLFGIKRVDPLGAVKKELSPNSFYLSQNYPNPFNPNTKIQYAVGSKQFLTLKVFDILGREVKILVNEEKPAGEYEVEFNGGNLSSGIYFYQLRAGNLVLTKKMIYLK